MQQQTSLRKRLTTTLFLVSMVPLVLLGLVLFVLTYQAQQEQSVVLAGEVLGQSISEIDWVTHELESRMTTFVSNQDIVALDRAGQKEALSVFRSFRDRLHGDIINDVRLIGRDGMELARVSRTEIFTDVDLISRAQEEYFLQPLASGVFYYGEVKMDGISEGPTMFMAMPVMDLRQGLAVGVLVVEIRLHRVWNKVVSRGFGATGTVYVTDTQGRVVSHKNPSLVYRKTVVPVLRGTGFRQGVEGEKSLILQEPFYLGHQLFYAFAELPATEALALPYRTLAFCVSLLVVFLLIVAVICYFQVNQVVRPIEELSHAASAIRAGEYHRRAEERGNREIVDLATSFNRMTSLLTTKIARLEEAEIEVQQVHGALERKVAERTEMLRQANRQLTMEVEVRKRAEETLTRYQQIVASSKDLMSFVDYQYVYRAVNDVYLSYLNRSREEIVGHTTREVLGDEIFEGVIRGNLERAMSGTPVRYESWIQYAGMGRRYMEISYEPCRGAGREIIGVAVNIRDVTERLMLEKNLRQSQKMQAAGTLAAGIAHDFNNILHSIYGCAEIASARIDPEDLAGQALVKIRQACGRAADLVRQVQSFSRQGDLDRQAFDLASLVREALRLHKVSLPSTIECEHEIHPCREVIGDASQIHQVVSNLIINAIHAMTEKGFGKLQVRLAETTVSGEQAQGHPDLLPGSYALLTVRDSGHGMDQPTMERVFEPFFTTKPIGKGTGLGLAICHGIITRHGGIITVDSVHGDGTVFEVYLPIGQNLFDRVLRDTSVTSATAVGCRVLYVDDETMNTEVWAMAFEHAGMKTVTANDGTEAMEIFMRDPYAFDVMITDQRMPEVSGLELAGQVKKIRPDLPVILVTGWNDAAVQSEEAGSPVDRILGKPIRMETMIKVINELRQSLTHAC